MASIGMIWPPSTFAHNAAVERAVRIISAVSSGYRLWRAMAS